MIAPELFIFAGEKSGDVLGGKLVEALKEKAPKLTLYGVGGEEMSASGMTIIHPMERFQVMGFLDVFKALPRLYLDLRKIRKEILTKQPAGVILIDYPDFNMRLAKALRSQGYRGKIIHYVCPSVWAWRKKRIYSLAKTLDHLLTILPFEKQCFHTTHLPVTYVGHPLVAAIDHYSYTTIGDFTKPIIAIFPGSRRHEVELNLPLQLQVAHKLAHRYTIAVSVASPHLKPIIQKYIGDLPVILVEGNKRYELMKQATAAIATSGTVVLELGLHATPTVVTYKLGRVNSYLAHYIFRIHLPYYTLVNIICEEQVYPEFIHKVLSAETIYQALDQLLENPQPCRDACKRLRERLHTQNASQEAAQTITKLLYEVPLS